MKKTYRKVPKDMIPEEIVIPVCWYEEEKTRRVIYDTEEMTRQFEDALEHLPERVAK